MKTFRLAAAVCALLSIAACAPEYDDSELRKKLSEAEERIAQLEHEKDNVFSITFDYVPGDTLTGDGRIPYTINGSTGAHFCKTEALSKGWTASVEEVDSIHGFITVNQNWATRDGLIMVSVITENANVLTTALEFKAKKLKCERVLVLYLDGFNNLTSYMKTDINEVIGTAPDISEDGRYKLLIFSHFTQTDFDYNTKTQSYLENIWIDENGNPVRDTIAVYSDTCISASANMISTVMNDVKELYPSENYGFLISTHGTGWLPVDYYDNYKRYEPEMSQGRDNSGRLHYLLQEPETKSIGCEAYYDSIHKLQTHEIDLLDFASAFPYHLEYIILDACLMGGIETAYQLRNCTDNILFSQLEIKTEGVDYTRLTSRMLYQKKPDYAQFCNDFLEVNEEGSISHIETAELEQLAEVCSVIFENFADSLQTIDADSKQIQGFFRYGKHWFYDLKDIFDKSFPEYGSSTLNICLNHVVKYTRYSDRFMSIKVNRDCGLSMYLPSKGTEYLNEHYRKLDWNKATHLVK